MTIEIQYVHMPTSETMNDLVGEKLNKLAKKYSWIIRAQVHFKLENDSSGNGKICEIELSAPGPRLFAISRKDNFEKALVSVIKELEHQLKKRKQMSTNH